MEMAHHVLLMNLTEKGAHAVVAQLP